MSRTISLPMTLLSALYVLLGVPLAVVVVLWCIWVPAVLWSSGCPMVPSSTELLTWAAFFIGACAILVVAFRAHRRTKRTADTTWPVLLARSVPLMIAVGVVVFFVIAAGAGQRVFRSGGVVCAK